MQKKFYRDTVFWMKAITSGKIMMRQMQKRHFAVSRVDLSDNKETKLESSDQEASPSSFKNTMVDMESGSPSTCLRKAISVCIDILKSLGIHLL